MSPGPACNAIRSCPLARVTVEAIRADDLWQPEHARAAKRHDPCCTESGTTGIPRHDLLVLRARLAHRPGSASQSAIHGWEAAQISAFKGKPLYF
jgi:hypothetical protein